MMEVCFGDDLLDRLETDPNFDGGFSQSTVTAFRRRIQIIRAAPDETVFYGMKSLRFHKLATDSGNKYSMRLNDQWQLIVELQEEANKKKIIVASIERVSLG